MNREQLANLLDGRDYTEEMTREEEQQAYRDRLVVMFGRSDDGVVARGRIDEEWDAYGGDRIYLPHIENECEPDCPYFLKVRNSKCVIVEAIQDEDGDAWFWSFRTMVPHSTFRIYDPDGMSEPLKYCKGIVFNFDDLERTRLHSLSTT